jgi:hypothetical protein
MFKLPFFLSNKNPQISIPTYTQPRYSYGDYDIDIIRKEQTAVTDYLNELQEYYTTKNDQPISRSDDLINTMKNNIVISEILTSNSDLRKLKGKTLIVQTKNELNSKDESEIMYKNFVVGKKGNVLCYYNSENTSWEITDGNSTFNFEASDTTAFIDKLYSICAVNDDCSQISGGKKNKSRKQRRSRKQKRQRKPRKSCKLFSL